jgi:exodeoxyribonuclease-3
MKIVSWNVNGIRAVEKKGFIDLMGEIDADIVALQETKAHPSQLSDELLYINGYESYFESAQKKGYSGVAIYSKQKPLSIQNLGDETFDSEGRVQIADFEDFVLINCYFPNSQEKGARLEYKLAFCDAILTRCNDLVASGKNVVLCGDYNIAHTQIDLKNPKSNENNPGFLPQERRWMSEFLNSGYADVFRQAHPNEEGHYTWWSYRFSARSKNIGWRIDYLCVNDAFAKNVKNPKIHAEIMGSDHCPVSIEIIRP